MDGSAREERRADGCWGWCDSADVRVKNGSTREGRELTVTGAGRGSDPPGSWVVLIVMGMFSNYQESPKCH